MAHSVPIKLPLLARRRRLPALPGQRANAIYGVVWGGCPMPAGGSCYIVEFQKGSYVEILAYVDKRGGVYSADRLIASAPGGAPDFAVVPDDDGRAGTVYVREAAELEPRGRYRGSFAGTMREVRDAETWNTARSLTYRPFMASMFLRYCVLDAPEGRLRAAQGAPDLTSYALERPVDFAEGFRTMALPDAIDALIYRIDVQAQPAGVERYARRLLGDIDLARLRTITAKTTVALAHIERMDALYLAFDHHVLEAEDTAFLYGVETVLNRIFGVVKQLGFGLEPITSSPGEAACSLIDQALFRDITGHVARLVEQASAENPWMRAGTVPCEPGGEWDVRTRFAAACESLNLIVHLEYDFRCRARMGLMHVRYTAPDASMMPCSIYDRERGSWRGVGIAERADIARECVARMALVLAAAAFSSGFGITRCIVEQMDPIAPPAARTFDIERTRFMGELVPLAAQVTGRTLRDAVVSNRLDALELVGEMPQAAPAALTVKPGDDSRPLPDDLRELLLADSAAELEVMEEPGDVRLMEIAQARARARTDPGGAIDDLMNIIEPIEAACAAQELLAERPLKSYFCENHLGRILMPLVEDDARTRILRVPDALFFARFETASVYARMGAFDRALDEARRLIDVAPTSMQAHFVLVNVLAHLARFREVIEVCRHGLRLAFDRNAIAYLFYRMAFAFWNTNDRACALACYRMVPPGEEISRVAQSEMRELMSEMGSPEAPSLDDAAATLRAADVPVPPTPEATAQVADAAVMLCDHGFQYLAARCVYSLWRVLGTDELGVVQKSLMPAW